jgi:hypothetical protein
MEANLVKQGSIAVLFSVLAALPALAQEKGRIGLDAAFNGSAVVGVTWHATEHLAFRPTFSYSHSSTSGDESGSPDLFESPTGLPSTIDDSSSTNGVGLALLYYLRHGDGLSPYLGVGYEHTHTTSTDTRVTMEPPMAADTILTMTTDNRANGNRVRAFVGAQHAFGKRFGLFGELGGTYNHLDSRFTSSELIHFDRPRPRDITESHTQHTTSNQFASFSAQVGAIFYLK